ncbi:MAG: ABC transporter permease [Dehalococcoidales bacterium]|nr:ABC transporter permease [Dehalococcoidales bacterium]
MFRYALTIAQRIIQQIIRDRRTLALILIVPVVVMTIIWLSFPEALGTLDYVAPALLATLALFFGFLLTGISFLRERSQGTLERLMASPVTRADIVLGYLLGFFLFALLQSLIIVLFTVYALNIHYTGAVWQIFIFQTVVLIGAINLGIFISAFAKNEFQMVQFIPLIILPQVFLCGLLWPVAQMSNYLQWISRFLPLTYAVDGLRNIMLYGKTLNEVGGDLAALAGFAIGMSIITGLSLRRGVNG